jgi:hypothetical protein
MADYEIVYSDARSDVSSDGMVISVEVAKDGQYLGKSAGLVPGVDYRRKYKEGRRLTLFFDGAARHLAEVIAEEIKAGTFRETWQLEAPIVPLDAARSNELAEFGSMHPALAEGDLLLKVST